MNEQDKQAFEAALNYAKAQNDMAHVERFDVFDFRTGWNAALEYARGQQEPVASRFRYLNRDGKPITAWAATADYPMYQHPALEIEPLYTHPAQPSYAEQCQAEGWQSVTNTLNEVMPGWTEKSDSGMEAACTAIRELAQPVQHAGVQGEPLVKDAEEYGPRLNEAGWAAIDEWNRNSLDSIPGVVFNNIKSLVRAAILKYCEGYTMPPAQPVQPVNEQLLEALKPFAVFGRVGSRDVEVRAAVDAIAAAEAAKWRV